MTIPVLKFDPILTKYKCTIVRGEERIDGHCVSAWMSDWEEVIRELKAVCLANGGSDEQCQTDQ